VLTYYKLDFIGEWEYSGENYDFRPIADQEDLFVVTEAPAGSLRTHKFTVHRGSDFGPDNVLVPNYGSIVYVPASCYEVVDGDATSCKERPKPPTQIPPHVP
jgi:hypothetical protein